LSIVNSLKDKVLPNQIEPNGGATMKSISRNVAIALFFAFAIGSIYGCAEKPITFAGPGVQIWKLNIVYDIGVEIKDQTLVLKPSETEKNVFHVTATIDRDSEKLKGLRIISKWKGEIRNGAMICNIDGTVSGDRPDTSGQGAGHGTAKGTFSKRRASGTISMQNEGAFYQGKWTAERIS